MVVAKIIIALYSHRTTTTISLSQKYTRPKSLQTSSLIQINKTTTMTNSPTSSLWLTLQHTKINNESR
ncbi:hypothetical protein DSB67_10130 [Vibrio campbellii]|nr:hypothetical protein DSB67_10130 [Vibrio campbellii]